MLQGRRGQHAILAHARGSHVDRSHSICCRGHELYYEETGQGVSIDLIRRLGFVRVQDFNRNVSRGKRKQTQEHGQAPGPEGIVEVPPPPARAPSSSGGPSVSRRSTRRIPCSVLAVGGLCGLLPLLTSRRSSWRSRPTWGSDLVPPTAPRTARLPQLSSAGTTPPGSPPAIGAAAR